LDNLIKRLSSFPNDTVLFIDFLNGLSIKGRLDTIYETDNGLEMDEEGYLEYYACSIKIEKIINQSKKIDEHFKEGNFIEISKYSELLKVYLECFLQAKSAEKCSEIYIGLQQFLH
jgi:hypothetical protein